MALAMAVLGGCITNGMALCLCFYDWTKACICFSFLLYIYCIYTAQKSVYSDESQRMHLCE